MPILYHNNWHKKGWFIRCYAFCVLGAPPLCHEKLGDVPWRTRKGQIKASPRGVFGVEGVEAGQVEACLVGGSDWKDCALRLFTVPFGKDVLRGLSVSQVPSHLATR